MRIRQALVLRKKHIRHIRSFWIKEHKKAFPFVLPQAFVTVFCLDLSMSAVSVLVHADVEVLTCC